MQRTLPKPRQPVTVQPASSFWTAASALFATVAVLKGLRRPAPWAVSQLRITYLHGFLKRGLLGQLLYTAHLRSLLAVNVFCALELATLLVLLAGFTWQSGLLHRRHNPALVAAFAGSYAVTFLAHLAGYHDIALYALTIAALLVRNPRRRFLLALPLCLVAPLVHELFLLTALPVLLFSFFTGCDRTSRRYAAVLVALAALSTLGLATRPALSPAAVASLTADTVARTPFPFDTRSFGVLGLSLRQNLQLNAHVIRHRWGWWSDSAVAAVVLGPLAFLLLFRSWRLAPGGQLRAALLCASLAPLLLNLISWDSVRWATLCALSSFLNLALLQRAAPPSRRATGTIAERHAAILVMGLGLASGHGLMDSARINPYPFFPPALRPTILRHDQRHLL